MAKCFKHVKCYNHFECDLFSYSTIITKNVTQTVTIRQQHHPKNVREMWNVVMLCVYFVCIYWMSKWIWIHLDRFFSFAYIFRVLSATIVAYGIIRIAIGWYDLKCIRWQMSLINTTLVLFGPSMPFHISPHITHIFSMCATQQ